jgi:hypothetical protein
LQFQSVSGCAVLSLDRTAGRSTSARSERLEVVQEREGARPSLEGFVAARFAAAYDAQVTHFCRHLVGARERGGGWHAAAGYTPAKAESLFLEHYLDEPVERLLARRHGSRVRRERIVEVGNLAATSPGMGRLLITALGVELHRAGYTWVVFTATREIRNAFTRLQLPLTKLVVANPSRLPDKGDTWGNYYAHDPHVMAGYLPAGFQRSAT